MKRLRIVLTIAAVVVAFASARAGEFERPPSFDVNKIFGSAAHGPGYRIVNPVRSDGYLRDYTIQTSYGTFHAGGDQMMLMRVKDMAALDALNRTANSQEFSDALARAGLRPVQFAGHLVTNPIGTVENTFSGIGQLFSGFAASVENAGKSRESALASISGEAQQKRLIAYKYGVDPYTQFKPLEDKLNSMATAAAAGKLVVSAAFMAIPGAAGTIVSNVSTASNLNAMIRDYSAAQLMNMNEKKLADLGIDREAIDQLMQNRHYTPVDITMMADALTRMGRVENMDVLVAHAAHASSREIAYFIRKRFEMIATYQQSHHNLRGFIRFGVGQFPVALTTDNGVAAIFPIDILSWTRETSRAITGATYAARRYGTSGPKIFYISGTTTRLAKRELERLGWRVEENAPL